ncbi:MULTISPECIES: phage holin family protein [Weissella]|uniref:Arginine/ornithine antiporter ArcD n=3 Tax=Weissella TaxID=46255 RepID=A0A1L6RA02_9LACO|nr:MULTISPECIES: phage holin family protein [Weissella]CCC56058.1 integral membrane protein [Weissella thailandensis fsh4-2]APS41366.1 Arginine/ornithine antiporter ArcD [Weissella jogaejeotgali]NKY91662.1 phage holin family protein [Weissella thailandensis]RDS58837.1 phage holin family protein [Weissella thailandensis]GEP75299.1 membrane protein [Weissella thailandensis]
MKTVTFKNFSFWQRIIINTVMLLAMAGLFRNGLYIRNIWTAILAAVILGILNALVKPVLHVLALPFTIISFGLFGLVINGVVLWLTAWVVGDGFRFASFGWAVFIAIVMSVVNMIISSYFSKEDKQ